MVMVALPPLSVAVCTLSLHDALPISVLFVLLAQSITGALVSTTVTVWLHWALLVQASVACQVRVGSEEQPPELASPYAVVCMLMVAVPLLSVAVGASKVQAVPNCTVL